MPSPWPVETLGEVVDRGAGIVQTGPFGSQLHASDYTLESDGVPLVMPKDMIGGRINYESMALVSPKKAQEMSRHMCRAGDVVLARRGDIGRCAFIHPEDAGALCGTGALRVAVQGTDLDPQFLFRYFCSEQGRSELESRTVGATMANLSEGAVRAVSVPVPPLNTQVKIGAILAAYDDLMDNNDRRVKVLEEMAGRIYHEWFVEFRYPGHERVLMVDSALGPIPREWQVDELGAVIQVIGGGTPSKLVPEFWSPGSVVWFTPTDLTRASAMFMTESSVKISAEGLARSSARLFPANSVMMTSRATIGVVSISAVQACTNQGFITCLPGEKVGPYHIYFWIKAHTELIQSLASGATFKEINKATFRRIPMLRATPGLERQFERTIEPIGSMIANLLKSQRLLAESRDLLLPRLISGAIEVSSLDIAMPPAAA